MSLRKAVSKIFRGNKDESLVAIRARMKESVSSKVENGLIGIYVWQMDCDCSSWSYHDVLPANIIAIDQYISNVYDNAEGRVSWHFVKPSDVPSEEAPSRDHILEAFEDGHPHYITY